MSISNAGAIFGLSAVIASDQADSLKSLFNQKLDSLKAKAKQITESRFSEIESRLQSESDLNQIRYELTAIKTDLVDLYKGAPLRTHYPFERKENIDRQELANITRKIKGLILQTIIDGIFANFKRNINACSTEKDILSQVTKVKNFNTRYTQIFRKQRIMPSPTPVPVPAPKVSAKPELPSTPVVTPIQLAAFQEFSKALKIEIKSKLGNTEFKSKKKPLRILLSLIKAAPEIFTTFLVPENRTVVTEIILNAIKDSRLSSITVPKNLLIFLKEQSKTAYKKVTQEITNDYNLISCSNLLSLSKRYYALKRFAQSQDINPTPTMGEKPEQRISYCLVRAVMNKINKESISQEKLKNLIESLPLLTKEIPNISFQDQKLAITDLNIALTLVKFDSEEECAWAEKEVLPKLSDPRFKKIKNNLETSIKAFRDAGLTGQRLYKHLAKWHGTKLPKEIQEMFEEKAAGNKEVEAAFETLFEAFNSKEYSKSCKICRTSILETLISFAKQFNASSPASLKKIAGAYRNFIKIRKDIEDKTKYSTERIQILGANEGSGYLNDAIPQFLEFFENDKLESTKSALIKILESGVKRYVFEALEERDYGYVRGVLNNPDTKMARRGKIKAGTPIGTVSLGKKQVVKIAFAGLNENGNAASGSTKELFIAAATQFQADIQEIATKHLPPKSEVTVEVSFLSKKAKDRSLKFKGVELKVFKHKIRRKNKKEIVANIQSALDKLAKKLNSSNLNVNLSMFESSGPIKLTRSRLSGRFKFFNE